MIYYNTKTLTLMLITSYKRFVLSFPILFVFVLIIFIKCIVSTACIIYVKIIFSQLSSQVIDKFNYYMDMLHSLKLKVENLYDFHLLHPITAEQQCCNISKDKLR